MKDHRPSPADTMARQATDLKKLEPERAVRRAANGMDALILSAAAR